MNKAELDYNDDCGVLQEKMKEIMSSRLVESLNLVERIVYRHAELLASERGAQHVNQGVTDAVIRLESAALRLNVALGRSIDYNDFLGTKQSNSKAAEDLFGKSEE